MDKIWDDASRFLANRMKTKKETKDHLIKKGYSMNDVHNLLVSFQEYGYLNDPEYVAVYISHGIQKGRTLWRVNRELIEKGISPADLEFGLQKYIEEYNHDPLADEYQRGRELAAKLIGYEANVVETKLLAKVGRKLVSLGYRPDMVYDILGEYMKKI